MTRHDLKIWGHELRIYDMVGSTTPELIERDMESDLALCGELDFQMGDVIVDVGAHVGIWSIAMAKQYPLACVIAVEAAKNNYDNLVRNIECNGVMGLIDPVHFAIYNEPREITLSQHPRNSGSSSMFLDFDFFTKVKATAITLDELLAPEDRVALLKLDIEGCEYQVLKDFKAWHKIDRLAVECHILPLHPDEAENAKQCVQLIDNFYGYIIKHIPPERIALQAAHCCYEWGVRKDRKNEFTMKFVDGL